MKYLIILFAAIFYALSLVYITTISASKHKSIKHGAELILAAACLTSIDFMSDAFEIANWFENLCYILMIFIVVVLPLAMQKLKDKE
ncbi:MAG: hypothetical protein IJW51_01845 [Clostridia bacterium]|nr:hypothetical protein [Clostridia bacterium]